MGLIMVRFGVIGAGNITKAFCKAIKKTAGILYGIASRSIEKAEKYKDEFGFEVAYGSYEELMKDSKVDVIYIATPHSHHYEQMLECLEHGKHILCEKAFTLNEKEARHVLSVAKENQLFVMEALWTRFLPVMIELDHFLKDGIIGELKAIDVSFGFVASQSDLGRLFNPKLGGGVLLDIGIYPLTMFELFVGYPDHINVDATMYHTGVDFSLNMVLKKNDVVGYLKASFSENLGVHAKIFGTKGYVEIPHFIGASQALIFALDDRLIHKIDVPHLENGMEYEIIEVVRMIENRKLESERMSHQKTLDIMKLMDSIKLKIKHQIDA
jgi:dihydrodiol dehydrogenase / D-xylose 1-dehydrogenase (NADP)